MEGIEFGIHLGAPAAEAMEDRHAHYRELLSRGEGSFRSACPTT